MARLIYASGPGDLFVAIDPGTTAYELPAAATYPVWTAATGGSQHTDLLTVAGAPIAGAAVDPANGRARFQGLDGYKGEYWLDVGGGTRYRVHPDGMAERLIALEAAIATGTLPDGDYGSVTISGGGTVITIDDAAVTLPKLADIPTATLLGRTTAGTGDVENLTATQGRTVLNVANGATANSADATLLARANHTGTQSADTLTDGTTNKAFLATERTKLTGIATGATANVAATSSVSGTVELATDAEAITGTDTVRATTPANIAAVLAAVAPGALPAYVVFFVKKAAGVWPARPTSDPARFVMFIGADPPPPIVTSGTAGMYDTDIQILAP